MANFTQSLSDSVRFFGIQPSSKFGSPMTWGTDLWGEGANPHFNMPIAVTVFKSDLSPVFTDAYITGFTISATLNDNLSMSQGPSQVERLTDPRGFALIFKSGSANNENTNIPTYQTSAVGASTWTKATITAGVWT